MICRLSWIVIVCSLCACQQRDSKRPQDKKMLEQQQKLDMAIKKLEAEADKVVRQGEQMYRDASRSVQQFSAEVEKQVQGIARSAEQIAQESQKLRAVPQALQQKSDEMVRAAQTALGSVHSNSSVTPSAASPAPAPTYEPFDL